MGSLLGGKSPSTGSRTPAPCGHQHQSDMPVVPFTMRDFMGQGVFESFVAGGTLGKRIAPGTPAGYAEALKTALVAT